LFSGGAVGRTPRALPTSIETTMSDLQRCPWGKTAEMIKYHDDQGIPIHDDKLLFEYLILEGAQAGLSWATILAKRENYRRAFDGFDFAKVALYQEAKVAALMSNAGIVRNRAKINAAITNARVAVNIVKKHGSLDAFFWSYVENRPIFNNYKAIGDIPVKTSLSERLSNDLVKLGMKFVGPVIMQSFLQATGMTFDHITTCHVHAKATASRSTESSTKKRNRDKVTGVVDDVAEVGLNPAKRRTRATK
jgi:DNA-3-methyladenine glycosylase I